MSILRGLSPTIGLNVSIKSGISSDLSSPAIIPMSIMSEPEATKNSAFLIKSSLDKIGALAISDNTLIGKSSPTGRFLTRMLFSFLSNSSLFSMSFSKSSMNFNACFFFSSIMSLSAGVDCDNSRSSTKSNTIAKSAASVDAL